MSERVPTVSSTGFDQHRATLASTDTFGGDAAFGAEATQSVDEMEHNARSACSHRVAEANSAAVYVEAVAIDHPQGMIKTEQGAAMIRTCPRLEAGEYLRREGLVKL